MKKIAICLLLSVCLCACSAGSGSYVKQDQIELNYNNISAHNDFWLTNESICYLEDNLVQNYYMATENGRSRLCSNGGYGFGIIQQYGNRIYMLDESDYIDEANEDYLLKYYDLDTKKTKEITSSRNCDNYLVLDEIVYYLKYNWTDDARILSLHSYSMDSQAHAEIHASVLSFGVIENSLVYLTEQDGTVSVYRYDQSEGRSDQCGQFSLEIADTVKFREDVIASYTPDYLLLAFVNDADESAIIWKYTFETGTVDEIKLGGFLWDFIAYEEYSYLALQEKEISTIFQMENATGDTTKIGEMEGGCSLFVGSDAGVYVLSHNTGKLFYSSKQSEPTLVYPVSAQ